MANPAIAKLIAERLASGLVHPGNPEKGEPPLALPLPGFRTAGMVPQMREAVEATTVLIAEAIVHLIETDGNATIVDNAPR